MDLECYFLDTAANRCYFLDSHLKKKQKNRSRGARARSWGGGTAAALGPPSASKERKRKGTPARGLPATSPPATLQISSVIPHGPTRPLNPRCRRHSPRTLAAPRRSPRPHRLRVRVCSSVQFKPDAGRVAAASSAKLPAATSCSCTKMWQRFSRARPMECCCYV